MDQNIPGARMSLGQDVEKTGQMPVVELSLKNNITVYAQNWLQFKGQDSAILAKESKLKKDKTPFTGTFDNFVKTDSVLQCNVLFFAY